MAKSDKSEILLSDKQLKGLEALGKIDVDRLTNIKLPPQLSWVGRMFIWIDINILDKTSRLMMYVLEIAGILSLYVIINKVILGLNLIRIAPDELGLTKAKIYIDSLVAIMPALAAMVATICGALPTVIAVFRSLDKKWKNGNGKQVPVASPEVPVQKKEPKSDVGSKIPPMDA
jgi:hypothetical protein